MSSIEELLKALLDGNTSDIVPQSRAEACLKNCLEGLGTEGLPPPESRIEAYLHALAEQGVGGGGRKINITNCRYMYHQGARLDDIPPSDIETGSCTDFYYMFYGCKSLTSVPALNTSKGTIFTYMFCNCEALTAIPELNLSNGTEFDYMFYCCKSLTSVPALNTGKGTNFESMFNRCEALESVAGLDLSNGTTFSNMFYGCKKLTSVPPLDTSKGTKFNSMFSTCEALASAPALDVSNGTDLSSLFGDCKKLISAPALDARKATTISGMFQNCFALTSIPSLDVRSCTNSRLAFVSCSKLTDVYLYNIKADLAIGSGLSYGNKLTPDSLIHTIRELRDTGSSKTLTMGSTNLEKLANVYVRTIEITDEMRAEDEFIDEKLPFEVCENTDEGATLITDYVLYKNWQLK